MIWFKGCPKCKGELEDNKDMFGYYIHCLQCGYHLSEPQIGKLWDFTMRSVESGRIGVVAHGR